MAIILQPSDIEGREITLIKAEQIICHDQSHMHNSPIQNMVTLEINHHIVDITQDGEYFNARIDEHLEQHNIMFDELTQYIKDNTS